ncbi:hypothetical protein J1N35_004943 [Gossypium stocksii]|uniref:Uncharacterized protein n=1 Tax=Gossypium stocksii TaxID=47602 RepID=A0A9D3WDP8_9ROSI|nr:hypothetical protein J1N35_004943 [Gossypium stocksii]
MLPAEFAWPHGATNELKLILLGKMVEPKNYFYTFLTTVAILSPVASPLICRISTKSTFGVITTVEHGLSGGSLKPLASEGEINTLFPRNQLSMQKFPYCPTEANKLELENDCQSTKEALKKAYGLHRKLEEDYENLVERNKRLEEHLTLLEGASKKLNEEIRLIQAEKVGFQETIKAIGEKHTTEVADS